VTLSADPDQLEQLLINIVRNAADAALETSGGVTASWTRADSTVEITIEDEGPGVQNTSNLFVPFFTTKPGGSGIGLALSRHIAEAHGGALTLENRHDARGARATVKLRL
jgi:two-component system nitrogen regulation sensor histidine kinase NtrY